MTDDLQPLRFAVPWIDDEEIDAVVEVLRSGWLTTGARTVEFEQRFAEAVGAPAALALNSGTAALHLALIGAGVRAGDTVVTTPLTFCSTVHVIEHIGAHPVLVDVEAESLNISPERVEEVTDRFDHPPAAVLPVHVAGRPVDLAPILDTARRWNAAVVEDAAHAEAAQWGGRPIGALDSGERQRAACFSFYVTKNITTGEGGMLTGDPDLVEEARRWSLHGMSRDAWRRYGAGGSWRYDVTRPGFKYNMSDMQAALGLVQLGRSAKLLAGRRRIAERYAEIFRDVPEIAPVSAADHPGHAWHLYIVRLTDECRVGRDDVITRLTGRGIGTSVHFIPVHLLEYYREKYGFRRGDFPRAEAAFDNMFSLPIYPRMTDDDVERVASAVADVVRRPTS